ncbi:phosphonate ABC transporter ATP-binding protein [Marinimicrococcus flavescens]|uniref:Phosphonate ABC transporter ATP-binding protein n=1 Tax=Marinimicrococcus flavescens TaxID=3031815 RepID=A0AAP3UY91_9PROT|nr:phosphonate ABC transporter ATP-binding protein [Marinimicrococcus flavescens]
MLTLDNLTKSFQGVRAVDGVSLSFEPGQMVGVIGASGAGKSTMLRLVNRLSDPTGGRIVCQGLEVSALRGRALMAWRARCAMIFQQFNLVGRLDVLTNVLLGRLNKHGFATSMLGRFSDAERTMALEALDHLGLAQTALQRADTLSGGQQQRVAIAKALLQEPEILLADEPIASLDPRNAQTVMEALRRINREQGITVLCNLHTLDTARAYCDRIVGMRQGRVVFDGPAAALSDRQAREIYGVAFDEAFHEAMTSTSLAPAVERAPALAPAA